MKELERLGRRRLEPDQIATPELARSLASISREIGRQVGLMIDRAGQVELVLVGDHRSIMIPALGQSRAAGGRLRGLRCLHTHLAAEGLTQDDFMDLLFLRLDLMSALEVDREGRPGKLHSAHLNPRPPGSDQDAAGQAWLLLPPTQVSRLSDNLRELIASLEGEFTRLRPTREVDLGRDRAILVSVSSASLRQARESMDELAELAASAGVVVLDTVIQRRDKINPRLILGRGKLGEIMLQALQLNANLLIFDQELNPSQVRSITDHTEMRVIDRTQLILDIFARRALSREGRLQVEMAQLKYMMPRLGTRDDALSRLTGGIGGRGPGETRLEVDRRRIRDRLAKLTAKLKEVAHERHRRRERRRKKEVPVLSLVGYTNAGKSTLLNALTGSNILAEDKLFATLDPTSRRLRFPEEMEVIITDTVGFINNLPAELLQAFKATLEELGEADLLIHVVDAGNPRMAEHIRVVEKLLRELDLSGLPRLTVFNKIDLVADREWLRDQAADYDAVLVSAMDPSTFPPLLERARKAILKVWQ
ncbi:GTPase HflX [Desulfurivibrio sp. D14AmB]|uniref:GTPase HflX n=1 Tax=Desulfurivibrio sp. D14AmB TaxID=3374370 RepID=UPI00376F4646